MDKVRRSLTPPLGVPTGGVDGGVHATRRAGARHEVSMRVALKAVAPGRGAETLEGWALNVGRGGVRVILEQNVEPGDEFEVTLHETASAGQSLFGGQVQHGCVVWVQEESDGVIVGIAFKNAHATGDQAAAESP